MQSWLNADAASSEFEPLACGGCRFTMASLANGLGVWQCEHYMILVLDNYDSFTYNLVQRLGEIDPTVDIRVIRNDKISVDGIRQLNQASQRCRP